MCKILAEKIFCARHKGTYKWVILSESAQKSNFFCIF